MLHALKDQAHAADILWLHAAENGDEHAFGDELAGINHHWPALTRYVWYRQPSANDRPGEDFHYQGVIALDTLATRLTDVTMHFYLCGPVAFMQFIARQRLELGITPSQRHYECFGPHKVV